MNRSVLGVPALTVKKVDLQLAHPQIIRPNTPVHTSRADQVVLNLDRRDRVTPCLEDLQRNSVLRPVGDGE